MILDCPTARMRIDTVATPFSRRESNARLADRLAAARRQRFVGRAAELALFASALAAPDATAAGFAVVYVHGPGGVGKTTLLQQFADLAEHAGRAIVRLDARDLEPTPDDMLTTLARALDLVPGPLEDLVARWPDQGLLVIDNYEPTPSLDDWLRSVLLPRLPARSLVLLAGRLTPAPEWITDIAWAPLTRIIALRNLDPDESRRYLAVRGVDELRQAGILAAVDGHPLALSLAADAVMARAASDRDFDLSDQPGIVRTLLHRLVDEVPSPRHRLALHACATVRVLTRPLLAAALRADEGCADPEADSHALFDWLSRLACIESSPQGLNPHDLAREVLYADARRTQADARRALNARLLGHLYDDFKAAEGAQRQRLWFDTIYVQRNNATLRRYCAWSAAGSIVARPLRGSDDLDVIRSITRRHEGSASAAIVAHWLVRQPDAFLGFIDLRGRLVGYMANLRLDIATDDDRRVDLAADRALAFIAARAPARSGEEIAYIRFWMADDGYQSNPSTMNVLVAQASLYWTTRARRLAWSLCAAADADDLEAMAHGVQMRRSRAADFALGPRRWGVFARDWRVETVQQWLRKGVERASVDEPPSGSTADSAPLLVLSEADFEHAVQQALRDFTRPEALAANPLLRTRLLARCARISEHEQPVAALRALLHQAAASLSAPKDRKSLAAIRHTYFEPATTQEQAAEAMGIPFNTYRYQLARGTRCIVQWLWTRELGSA